MASSARHRAQPSAASALRWSCAKGAAKPDISTPRKLRKVLLDARKIVHSRPGDTRAGKFLIEVFQDLGVTEEMKPKVVFHNVVDGGTELIVRGDVDFGLYPASAMIPIKGRRSGGIAAARGATADGFRRGDDGGQPVARADHGLHQVPD